MTAKKNAYHHPHLRQTLLNTTADMIAEGGVDSVTMRSLAKRIGVSRAAPYRHFTDKAALLAAVAEEGFKRLQQCLHDAVHTHPEGKVDSIGRFRQAGFAYIEFARRNPTHYRLMFSQDAASRDQYPTLKTAAAAAFQELQKMIEWGQQEGKIKPQSPALLTYTTWAMVHGVSLLLIDQQTNEAIQTEAFIQAMYDALTTGILLENEQSYEDATDYPG